MPPKRLPKKTCGKCFWFNWTDALFCNQCGGKYPLRNPAPTRQQHQQQHQPLPTPPSKRGKVQTTLWQDNLRTSHFGPPPPPAPKGNRPTATETDADMGFPQTVPSSPPPPSHAAQTGAAAEQQNDLRSSEKAPRTDKELLELRKVTLDFAAANYGEDDPETVRARDLFHAQKKLIKDSKPPPQ